MKKLKWKQNRIAHQWWHEEKDNNGNDILIIIEKTRGGYNMSPRAGIWHLFQKLSTAKKVAQLIYNG